MKFPVECLLKRSGGTVVDLHGTTYHFKADNDPAGLGRHVCDVPNAKHLQRFMQIPEAYAILDDDEPAITTTAPVITTPAPVNLQAIGVASGPAPDLGAAIAQSPQTGEWADPAATAPVTLTDPDGNPTSNATPEPIPADPGPVTLMPPPVPVALPNEAEMEAMDLDALRLQAEKELGRKPSPKAKAPLLISQIMAIRAEAPAA